MPEPVLLSIIIPSYDSAGILDKNLPVLLEYLDRQKFTYEIVVVDDGSADNGETEKISLKYGCRYLQNEKNLGKGASVRKGMLSSGGACRIFTDADIPYGVETIGIILQYLQGENVPMVIGDRNLADSSYFSEIPRFRRISSIFFTHFVGRIVTSDFYDTQCGIKGFRASAAEIIFVRSRIDGFTFDVEIIYIALKLGIPITKVAVQLRNQEKSTVRVFRDGILMFMDLFRIKLNQLRGYYL